MNKFMVAFCKGLPYTSIVLSVEVNWGGDIDEIHAADIIETLAIQELDQQGITMNISEFDTVEIQRYIDKNENIVL